MAINEGMGPKGTPWKSMSKPATMTRLPLSANFWQTSGSASSKKLRLVNAHDLCLGGEEQQAAC